MSISAEKAPQPQSVGHFVSTVLKGATTATPPALIGSLIVCARLFLSCAILITPRLLSRHDPGYLMIRFLRRRRKLSVVLLDGVQNPPAPRRIAAGVRRAVRDQLRRQEQPQPRDPSTPARRH